MCAICPVLQVTSSHSLRASFHAAHFSLSQDLGKSTPLVTISLCLVLTLCFPSHFNHQTTHLSCSHCSQDQNQESYHLFITFKGIIQLSPFISCLASHLVPSACVRVYIGGGGCPFKYFFKGWHSLRPPLSPLSGTLFCLQCFPFPATLPVIQVADI